MFTVPSAAVRITVHAKLVSTNPATSWLTRSGPCGMAHSKSMICWLSVWLNAAAGAVSSTLTLAPGSYALYASVMVSNNFPSFLAGPHWHGFPDRGHTNCLKLTCAEQKAGIALCARPPSIRTMRTSGSWFNSLASCLIAFARYKWISQPECPPR